MSSLRPGTIISVVWSGIALASDGYNSQVLSAVNVILKKLYPHDYTSEVRSRVSTAYYVGVCLGAVFFGSFIDRVSRKAGVLSATILLILGVALCASSNGTSIDGMFWMLTICRGILGFGAGGEYPVSSTAATEAGNETARLQKIRGFLVGMVGCTAIDFGIVFGGIIPLIILAGYGYQASTSSDTINGLHVAWRLMIALGAIVPASVFWFRWRMASSTSFEKHGRKHKFNSAFWIVVLKTYWLRMIGTCLCWALYNAVAYPFGLFTSTIIDQLSGGEDSIVHSIGFGTLVNAFLIPGCFVGSWLLDRIGRRNTQVFGFASSSILAFILGGALLQIQKVFPLFIVMYGILLALLEAGPGVGTLLTSAECYPTAIRGHMVGLSAAFGKAGAAIGVVAFGAIQDRLGEDVYGQRGVFLVGAAFSLLGALITFICIPKLTGNLENEDYRFQQILADNGIVDDLDENVLQVSPHLNIGEKVETSPTPSVDEKK